MAALPDTFPAFPELRPGEVWLVGAGPGDPRLLTLMAVHALQHADDIVHDALIDTRVLALVPPGAKLHPAGKRGGKPSARQGDINALMIRLAGSGSRVVRLKGGDPFVFGRGGEEASALAAAGVPFRVVPGLTAGLAGAALVGIPATTRETNHAVILATGHLAAGEQEAEKWASLARSGQPIVLYMGVANLGSIADALIEGGLPPDTPTAIIEQASTCKERVLETKLALAAAAARRAGIGSPAVAVIGTIVALRATLASLLRREE